MRSEVRCQQHLRSPHPHSRAHRSRSRHRQRHPHRCQHHQPPLHGRPRRRHWNRIQIQHRGQATWTSSYCNIFLVGFALETRVAPIRFDSGKLSHVLLIRVFCFGFDFVASLGSRMGIILFASSCLQLWFALLGSRASKNFRWSTNRYKVGSATISRVWTKNKQQARAMLNRIESSIYQCDAHFKLPQAAGTTLVRSLLRG